MATVTGLTAARMLAIENNSVVNGFIDISGNLILEKHNGTQINAGYIEADRLLTITDTPSVDLQLTGNGSIALPWNLQANTKLSLTKQDSSSILLGITGAGTTASPWQITASLKNRGTTAERNALYAPPTTDPQRVDLANQKITWFNTDLGWEESYYAVTGLSGLTARGLVTGTASGWYPTGLGPRLNYAPTTQHNTSGSGANVTGWSTVSWINGAGWFSYASGVFTFNYAGRYRISMAIGLINGSGVADFHHYAGTNQRNVAMALYTGQYNILQHTYHNVEMSAGATSRVALMTGNSLTVFIGTGTGAPYRGEFDIQYLGPALVSS